MNTEIFISTASLTISGISLLCSLLSFFRQRTQTAKDFFLQGDTEFLKSCRKQIYNIPDKCEEYSKYEDSISQVVSFYDCWALMVKRKYLPIWVFDGMAGDALLRQYKKILPYIELRRFKGDTNYAMYFEWLQEKIKKNHR